MLTRLMEQACLAIRKQRFRDPLPITVRKTVRPQKSAEWETYFPPPPDMQFDSGVFSRPGWASAVVEVEINPIEYLPTIRGSWLAVDGGKILFEDQARLALRVSAAQALGWAYREHLSYVEGVIPHEQIENYAIPSPGEISPIHINFICNASDEPKGLGDLPFTCIPAAYLQAVSQAMDHPFEAIPLKKQDIWEVEQRKKMENLPV